MMKKMTLEAYQIADAIAEIISEDTNFTMKVKIQRVKEVFYSRLQNELTYPQFVDLIITADNKRREQNDRHT